MAIASELQSRVGHIIELAASAAITNRDLLTRPDIPQSLNDKLILLLVPVDPRVRIRAVIQLAHRQEQALEVVPARGWYVDSVLYEFRHQHLIDRSAFLAEEFVECVALLVGQTGYGVCDGCFGDGHVAARRTFGEDDGAHLDGLDCEDSMSVDGRFFEFDSGG